MLVQHLSDKYVLLYAGNYYDTSVQLASVSLLYIEGCYTVFLNTL